jgi:N6-adenosine-specific RNA methylase IME4
LILAPVREHSRKPDEMFARVERYCDGPYVELFARQSRPGWSTWGNESWKFDATPEGPRAYDEAIREKRRRLVAAGELPRIEGYDP